MTPQEEPARVAAAKTFLQQQFPDFRVDDVEYPIDHRFRLVGTEGAVHDISLTREVFADAHSVGQLVERLNLVPIKDKVAEAGKRLLVVSSAGRCWFVEQ